MLSKQNQTQHSTWNFDDAKLNALNAALLSRIEDVAEEFGAPLEATNRLYYGHCFVHGGDSPMALNVYVDGHTMPGYWRCNTKECHKCFAKNPLGLVHGALSHRYNKWSHPHDKKFSFYKTVMWSLNFLGVTIENLESHGCDRALSQVTKQLDLLSNNIKTIDSKISRRYVRQALEIPAYYFLKRDYSSEVLNHFDIGLCRTKKKPMYNRIVVPVYNEKKHVVGCVGRSIYPQCQNCQLYHPSCIECSKIFNKLFFAKWKNSPNFNREYLIYNFHDAKREIQNYKNSLIIVEGPADLWRLYEAGYKNCIALFGANMTDAQQILIESTAARQIILMLDNDEAGINGRNFIKQELGQLYNIEVPEFHTKDVGELKPKEVNEVLWKLKIKN